MPIEINNIKDIYALMRVQERLFPFLKGNMEIPSTNELSLRKQVAAAEELYHPIFIYVAGEYFIQPEAKVKLDLILKMFTLQFKPFELDLPNDIVEQWKIEKTK